MGSLKAEASSKTVGVHTLSPGMVLTDLLLEGATLENKQIFNILCEQVSSLSAVSQCCALRPCSVGVHTCTCTLVWQELCTIKHLDWGACRQAFCTVQSLCWLLCCCVKCEVSVIQFCMHPLEGPCRQAVNGYRCGTKLSLFLVTGSYSCLM